jgi:hypothetical protein
MENAGYSRTPLLQKLGIRPGMKIMLVHPPENYFELLGMNITPQLCHTNDIPDLVHLFAANKKNFQACMKTFAPFVLKNSSIIIWVSWYKKSSKIQTDITEDTIRDFALAHNLVDVKVCAVSDIWSGLKLVVPLSKRKSKS